MSYNVGDRVKAVTKEYPNGIYGIARFIGTTQFASDVWVGVEQSTAGGKNNGSVQGIEYFHCEQQHGLFVKSASVFVATPSMTAAEAPTIPEEEDTPFGLDEEGSSDEDQSLLHDIEILRTEIASLKQDNSSLQRKVMRLETDMISQDKVSTVKLEGEVALYKHRYEVSVSDLDAVLEEISILEEEKKQLQGKYDSLLKDNSAQSWENQLVKVHHKVTQYESNEAKLKKYIEELTSLLREQAAVLGEYDVLEKESQGSEAKLQEEIALLKSRVNKLEGEKEQYELRITRLKTEGKDVAEDEIAEQLDLASKEQVQRAAVAEERVAEYMQKDACLSALRLASGAVVRTDITQPESMNLIGQREEAYEFVQNYIKTITPVHTSEPGVTTYRLARAMCNKLFLASTVALQSVPSFVALSQSTSQYEKKQALQTVQVPEHGRQFFLLQSVLVGMAAVGSQTGEEHDVLVCLCHLVLGAIQMDPTLVATAGVQKHLEILLSDACRTNLGFQVNLYANKQVMIHSLCMDNSSVESNTFTLQDFTHYMELYLKEGTLPREMALICVSSEQFQQCKESLKFFLHNICLCLRVLDSAVPGRVESIYIEVLSYTHELMSRDIVVTQLQYTSLSVLYMVLKLAIQLVCMPQKKQDVDMFCMCLMDLLPQIFFRIEFVAIVTQSTVSVGENTGTSITVIEGCSREEEAAQRREVEDLQKRVKGLTAFVSTVGSSPIVSTPSRPTKPVLQPQTDTTNVLNQRETATILTSKTRAYLSNLTKELNTLKLQVQPSLHTLPPKKRTVIFPLLVTESKQEVEKVVTTQNVQATFNEFLYAPKLLTLDSMCVPSTTHTWSTSIHMFQQLLDK